VLLIRRSLVDQLVRTQRQVQTVVQQAYDEIG
jgi:hypothetical protein